METEVRGLTPLRGGRLEKQRFVWLDGVLGRVGEQTTLCSRLLSEPSALF